MAADQEILNWFGGIVAALWIAFFGMQQRKINQMISRDEFDDAVNNAEKTFDMRRETVEQRMGDLEGRIDRQREDIQAMEARLTNEIRNSENRLLLAFKGYSGER